MYFDVSKVSRATSAMVDVLIDEQEMPEPVRLRAICVVSGGCAHDGDAAIGGGTPCARG